MVQKGVSEMINGVWRIKWWKYRYVVIAVLLVNVVVINHFFFDQSLTGLNPFRSSEIESEGPPPPSPPPPEHLADPEKQGTPAEPEQPVNPDKPPKPTEPSKPAKPSAPVPVVAATPPASSSTYNLNDYDFNGEYVGWPLERVCKETKWTPGLVYVCDNNSGGIGNIRNFILTCIRYAIDAGAAGILTPRIQRRSEKDLANIFTTGFQPFDYFFDEKHFRDVMGAYCPQMKIYNTGDDIPNAKNRIKIDEFYPKDLNIDLDGCDGRGVNRHLDMFRVKHDEWLHKYSRFPNATVPVTVRFKWATFFEWPIYRDGPEFAATFGDVLRIRKDIEELAAITIMEMSKFVGVEPDSPNPKTLDAPYLGVHLRTESDALGFWPDFNVQSEGYLKEAGHRGLKHAYIATGNATDGHRFGEKAWEKLGMNVTSKTDLLKGKDLKRLQDLSWDQQALVDFLVLMKSTHFTGCSFSSFTMNIAFKRHLMTGGINTRQWKSPGDEYTTLVGRFESWYGDWMFMYECLWP
jgi:hypothetical protein